jgi:hypothetical protein
MTERRPVAPLVGMGVVAVVCVAIALVLTGVSTELQARLLEFYNQDVSQQIDEQTYREWNRISTVAYSLQSVVMPLFLVSLIAVFAIPAVLARRADLRRARPATDEPG